MADVNKLVFSIIKFLKDQTTTGPLTEESIESLEGNIIHVYICVHISEELSFLVTR